MLSIMAIICERQFDRTEWKTDRGSAPHVHPEQRKRVCNIYREYAGEGGIKIGQARICLCLFFQDMLYSKINR